jgi:hypothetical protein
MAIMKLTEALKVKSTTTENGMPTHTTSLNFNVDLFFRAGAMRKSAEADIISLVSKAWHEDPTTCLRILFWARDIRGGAGERRFFRIAIKYIANIDPLSIANILALIPVYGRWDDLLVFENTHSEEFALSLIATALDDKNSLCAKWMPRKGFFANKIKRFMKLSHKDYRKCLVNLTNVVETAMCANDWETINYEHVPSLAMTRYGKAFSKHTIEKFSEYLNTVQKGNAKINAGAIYPYDVTKALYSNEAAEELWKALPNYLKDNSERILPLVDVSGSMKSSCGGSLQCIDVAVSLGLYISERNEGPYKDHFITFSQRPELVHLTGSLKHRYDQMLHSSWGMNTNLMAAYELILKQAVLHNIQQNEMPTQILILSDMEFDEAASQTPWNPTAQEMITKLFSDAGYTVPNVVYWNLQSRNSNVPASFNETGTALISGFSPAIMTSLLNGSNMTPYSIMMKTINSERYFNIKYETK